MKHVYIVTYVDYVQNKNANEKKELAAKVWFE